MVYNHIEFYCKHKSYQTVCLFQLMTFRISIFLAYLCSFYSLQFYNFIDSNFYDFILLNRVRRDPGTRPVPNFFSSTRPVPTRKLKMTGYQVIKFLFESNETQPRMKRTAKKVTNPITLAQEIIFCNLLRKVNKNRCSNLLSVPEAH